MSLLALPRNTHAITSIVLLFLTGFEAVVLAELVFYPTSGIVGGPYNNLVWYDATAYRWIAPLSILPAMAILYGWVLKWGVVKVRKYSSRFQLGLKTGLRILVRFSQPTEKGALPSIFRHPKWLLVLALATGALVGLYPYRADLNPGGILVGVDTPQYVSWIREMLGRSAAQAISYAFGGASSGSRPLPLLLFYSVAALGAAPEQVVKYSPVLFAPMLALSCYVFARAGRGGGEAAATAAIFGSLSFDTTVGIWAGYYANWLAMILGYFFLAFFLALQSIRRPTFYIATLLLSLAVLWSHPWTWALFLTATIVFSATKWRSTRDVSAVKIAVLIVTVGLSVDLLRTLVSGGSTLGADLGTKGNAAGISQLLEFWPDLINALTVFYDGLLGNFVVLALAALGFFSVLRRGLRSDLYRMLASWVGSSSIPFVFFNSFHQSRIIYDLPIPVLASLGLLLLLRRCEGATQKAVVFALVLLLSANYAVRSVIQA